MSIDRITARILEEAREDAAVLTNRAGKEASDLLAEASAQALEIAATMSAKAKEDAETLKERKKSVAELEARKMLLAAKQEMIEKSFGQAVEELAAMPEGQYLDFLAEQLAGYDRGEVMLSAKDRAAIGEKLAARLPKGITLSKETADIAGGFILKDGLVSVNGSLESMLDGVKKDITAQIAGVLFS